MDKDMQSVSSRKIEKLIHHASTPKLKAVKVRNFFISPHYFMLFYKHNTTAKLFCRITITQSFSLSMKPSVRGFYNPDKSLL